MKHALLEVTGQGTDQSANGTRQAWQAFRTLDADGRVLVIFCVNRDLPSGPFFVAHEVLANLSHEQAHAITAQIKDMKSWTAVKKHLAKHFDVQDTKDWIVHLGQQARARKRARNAP